MFDITFISYKEPNADENWRKLKERFPFARRVHGIEGIHNAHVIAAKKSYTKMFWVVDGDSEILPDFNFDNPHDLHDGWVYVYRAKNPINGLEYGNGGIKLLPRFETANMDTDSVDMTTSISKCFVPIKTVASITCFNTDEYNTWRSAFRECVKLSAKSINRQDNDETEQRLLTWCTVGKDKLFGEWAIRGAIAGKEYGFKNLDNNEAISKINDFNWLSNYFKEIEF